jgi:hypothetical protein
MKLTFRRTPVVVGAILLIVAGLAHAFGFAQFEAGLAGVDPETRAGLHAGWLWGSATFIALGVITFGAAHGWSRGLDPRPAVVPTAVALLVFGSVGFVARGMNLHFLGFVALGALLGLPMIGANGEHEG